MSRYNLATGRFNMDRYHHMCGEKTGVGRGIFLKKYGHAWVWRFPPKILISFRIFLKKNHGAKHSVRSLIIVLEQFFHGGIEIAPFSPRKGIPSTFLQPILHNYKLGSRRRRLRLLVNRRGSGS